MQRWWSPANVPRLWSARAVARSVRRQSDRSGGHSSPNGRRSSTRPCGVSVTARPEPIRCSRWRCISWVVAAAPTAPARVVRPRCRTHFDGVRSGSTAGGVNASARIRTWNGVCAEWPIFRNVRIVVVIATRGSGLGCGRCDRRVDTGGPRDPTGRNKAEVVAEMADRRLPRGHHDGLGGRIHGRPRLRDGPDESSSRSRTGTRCTALSGVRHLHLTQGFDADRAGARPRRGCHPRAVALPAQPGCGGRGGRGDVRRQLHVRLAGAAAAADYPGSASPTVVLAGVVAAGPIVR